MQLRKHSVTSSSVEVHRSDHASAPAFPAAAEIFAEPEKAGLPMTPEKRWFSRLTSGQWTSTYKGRIVAQKTQIQAVKSGFKGSAAWRGAEASARVDKLRVFESINFKLFALIGFFVVSTIVYGTYLSTNVTRAALAKEIEDRNIDEHLGAWQRISLEINHRAELAQVELFGTVPASQKELMGRLAALIKRKKEVKGARVDWFAESSVVASDPQLENALRESPKESNKNTEPQVFLTTAGNAVDVGIRFKTNVINVQQKSAAIVLVFSGRQLLKSVGNSEESTIFLLQPQKSQKKKQLYEVLSTHAVLSLNDDDIKILQRELPSSAYTGKFTNSISFWNANGENLSARYLQKPLVNSDVRLLQRFDRSISKQAIDSRTELSVYAGLIILGFALLVSYLASIGFNRNLERIISETRRLALGDLSPIRNLPRSEIGLLGAAINLMSQKLALLIAKQVESAKKENELLTAKAVEETFFLSEKRKMNSQLKISGKHRSATECAGDWWCHFNLGDDNELVVIADATGHGAGAALMVGVAYSFFQTYVQAVKMGLEKICEPQFLLERLNRILCDTSSGTSTMTMQLWRFDHVACAATYANAGHNHPIATMHGVGDGDPNTPYSSMQKAKGKELETRPLIVPGEILGMNPAAKFSGRTISYHDLKRLFLFTDGLTECPTKKGKKIRIKSIQQLLQKNANPPFAKSAVEIESHINDLFNGVALGDDVTFVYIELPKLKISVAKKHETEEQSQKKQTQANKPEEKVADPIFKENAS